MNEYSWTRRYYFYKYWMMNEINMILNDGSLSIPVIGDLNVNGLFLKY